MPPQSFGVHGCHRRAGVRGLRPDRNNADHHHQHPRTTQRRNGRSCHRRRPSLHHWRGWPPGGRRRGRRDLLRRTQRDARVSQEPRSHRRSHFSCARWQVENVPHGRSRPKGCRWLGEGDRPDQGAVQAGERKVRGPNTDRRGHWHEPVHQPSRALRCQQTAQHRLARPRLEGGARRAGIRGWRDRRRTGQGRQGWPVARRGGDAHLRAVQEVRDSYEMGPGCPLHGRQQYADAEA
mmetsp:Transcript_17364/g.48947  ORF Transcript_17364/g.48947 Transcript_17364/m.48947 type:complete len:236 (+) Transcript_17364:1502-2209(+)